ncbi:MAG: chemotaxis protein CheD [Sulfurospirillum sp.]|jgi:chemotaxis protein CheD|uniref:chemotaxis protein CheD n=1 Tax=Sulfurospirillum sp. UCH001 TaxID=1581011 RepID=UPI00082F3610|nr:MULTISPECIES: chemotaxis protein CheD [unclassified Sulfurospirillum]WNY99735.1 putative chemoreceptor glutamine deamidase CheD [Sulfurospirillum sp. 'SP']
MLPRKFIHVGEIFVGIKPTEIVTVLGSCVGVCLYDKVELIGGMNHYLLPLWNGNGLESPKYGNVAIPKLIENMENIGCLRRNMEAKIFGGANIHRANSEGQLIGQKNVLIAKEILRQWNIPIKAEDTGGNNGRRIMMISDANRIILKYVQNEIME